MKRKILNFITKLLSSLTGRKFVYYKPGNSSNFGQTAVKSPMGFWYVGNVLDEADIAYGILNNGLVEREGSHLVQKVLQCLLAEGNLLTFYDLGANTGYFGIMAAFLGQGKIYSYAFEPVEEFNQAQRETVKLNRLEASVRVFNLALGNDNQKAEIFLAGTGTSLSHSFVGNGFKQTRIITKARLDDVVAAESLAKPDFVKIDVEGSEYEALLGAQQLIQAALPIIWFETAKTLKRNGFYNLNYQPTMELLASWGYRLFRQERERLLPMSESHPTPDGALMYLALQPKNHKRIFELLNLHE